MSPSSVAIAELVAMFLEGLKERSVFAMALQDRKATGAQPGGEGWIVWSVGGWLAHPHVSVAHVAGLQEGPEQREGKRATKHGGGQLWAKPSLLQNEGLKEVVSKPPRRS